MKKRLALLIVLLTVLLIPHTASANSPGRDPWAVTVYVENATDGGKVTAFFAGDDGAFREGEHSPLKGEDRECSFRFLDGDTQFYLLYTAPDGTEQRSDAIRIVTYGKYRYDAGQNLLEEKTSFYNRIESCKTGSTILLFLAGTLLVPFAATLLLEWIVALCFKIRPVKYVFAINALTNPVMNLLLLFGSGFLIDGSLTYWIVLTGMELLVVLFEYLFYRKKLPHLSMARRLAFTVTANAVSLAVGLVLLFVLF